MPDDRKALPQLNGDLFLTDGGIETTLIFHEGIDLPHFAAFDLLKTRDGREQLRRYYAPYVAVAARHRRGFIFESPTWRANLDWGEALGYDKEALAAANMDAVALMKELRADAALEKPAVVSGCIGPRGDGYDPGALMTVREAEAYHGFQADVFARAGVDMITGITISNAPEAAGLARAAAAAGVPSAVAFTVETDGRLPSGQPLGEAIMEVDFESTTPPAYYMVNCAHPTHFAPALEAGGPWLERLKGVRANASRCSHAELDAAETLDDGDPQALGRENADLRRLVPGLTVFGGCCGTDQRHVEEIAKALAQA